MADFLQTLIISVVLGSLYALIALGYTMVFGVLKLINFAHSDIVVLGAWISLTAATFLLPMMGVYLPEAPWWSAFFVLLVAMLLCGGIGFCIERFAYKPIRKAPRLNALITAIGVSLLLQNVGQLQFDVVKSTPVVAVSGQVAKRLDARDFTLDQPFSINTGGTYTLRFIPAAAPPTTSPTVAPPGSEDRPLALRPGVYPAGTTIALERGLGSKFADARFVLLRQPIPLKLPFGAKPSSLPREVVPDGALAHFSFVRFVKTTTTAGVSSEVASERLLESGFGSAPTTLPVAVAPTGWADSDSPDSTVRVVSFGKPVRITLLDTMVIGTAIVLMIALQFLVFGTRIGTAMRAVSYNMDTAALMGIPVNRIVSFTFVTGTMLAAAAGFLYAMKYAPIQQPAHTSWTLLGLKAFIAAVVGGIGNIRGAVVGGFLIAFIENFSAFAGQQLHWDWVSSVTDVFVFALLIVVLLVKPTGIFGSTIREKV